MNHLKTGECNYSCRRGPEQVSCTPTIKSRNAFFLENFLDTIKDTCILLLRMVPLFLEPWPHHLQIKWYFRQPFSQVFSVHFRTKLYLNHKECWKINISQVVRDYMFLMHSFHTIGTHCWWTDKRWWRLPNLADCKIPTMQSLAM